MNLIDRDLVAIKKIKLNLSSVAVDINRVFNSPGKYLFVNALDVGGRHVYISINEDKEFYLLETNKVFYFAGGFRKITVYGNQLTGRGGDEYLSDIELWVSEYPLNVIPANHVTPLRTANFDAEAFVPDGEIMYIYITGSGDIEYSTKGGTTGLIITVTEGTYIPLNPWKISGVGTTAAGTVFYRR